jgi:hypothetical protein
MEFRLARFFAITLVIVVLGGLLLSGRARKLRRELAAAPAADTMPAASLDSARAVALARDAYRADHAARGDVARATRVAAFTSDSVGFVIELAPADSAPGTRAVVHVQRSGPVQLRHLGP